MSISYQKLWNLLAEKQISKTEFRQMIDVSTVTLAKLSAGESVNLAIIEKICEKLQCSVEDVLEIQPPRQEGRWKRLEDSGSYLVHLLYLVADTEIRFLYGYAVPCEDGANGRSAWVLEKKPGNEDGSLEIWTLGQIVSGMVVRKLIAGIEQGKTIGEFLEENLFTLSCPNGARGKWAKREFPQSPIYTGEKTYRPEILLVPQKESEVFREETQPFHAWGNEVLFSESYVSNEKKALYYNAEGGLDLERMDLIRKIFREKGMLINGYRDIERIGDFEVLSLAKGNLAEGELFEISSILEDAVGRDKRITGYEVTIFQKYLQGEFLLEVTSYHLGNVTACRVFGLVVGAEDIKRKITFDESSSEVEVRLYEMRADSGIELIGWKKCSFMTRLFLTLNVQERQGKIEDRHTRKAQRRNKPVSSEFRQFSSWENSAFPENYDTWGDGFAQVRRDFREIYGKETAESRFFAGGTEGHEAFLQWLRKKVNESGVYKAFILDPYIDTESISRLQRTIENMGIPFTVVTDTKSGGKEKARIDTLEQVCTELKDILPRQMEILAYDSSDLTLHDRFLILYGRQYFPQVYCMSNSLDNMAARTPSVLCKLDRETGREVAEYYLSKLENTEKPVRTLYKHDVVESADAPTTQNLNGGSKNVEAMVLEMNRLLAEKGLALMQFSESGISFPDKYTEEEIQTAVHFLGSTAKDHWKEFAYICWNFRGGSCILEKSLLETSAPELSEVLAEFAEKAMASIQEEANVSGKLWVHANSSFSEELQMASVWMYDPDVSSQFLVKQPETALAVEMLILCDFSRYEELIHLTYESGGMEKPKQRQFLLGKLAKAFHRTSPRQQELLAEKCLRSAEHMLVAMGIQWFLYTYLLDIQKIKYVAEILRESEHLPDFFAETAVQYQIELLSGQRKTEKRQEIKTGFEKMKKLWVEMLPFDLGEKDLERLFTPLNRNAADICDMLSRALEAQKTESSTAQSYLLKCLFKGADAGWQLGEGTWDLRRLADAKIYLLLLLSACGTDAVQKVLQKVWELEKKLIRDLHDVFLYTRDYSKWKCYMDMLVWCELVRMDVKAECPEYESLAAEDGKLSRRDQEIKGLFQKYEVNLKKYSELYSVWEGTVKFGENVNGGKGSSEER